MAGFKVRRVIKGTGGAKVGTATNYTDLSTAGYQTMYGTARVRRDVWIRATDFYMGSASAAGGGLLFDAGSMQSARLPLGRSGSTWGLTAAGSFVGLPL